MEDIKISVSEGGRNDGISVLRVDGVIDTLTATQLEEVLDTLLKRGRFNIILDLAGVEYISSAGWGIFISRIKEIRENKGDIKLSNMIPNVHEIYELLEFDNILDAHDNVHAARSAFGAPQQAGNPKKKAPVAGTRTTIEELFSSSQSASPSHIREHSHPSSPIGTGSKTEQVILDAIGEDPFYTISELKLVVEESLLDARPGWWNIFKILWKKKLLSRRSRFHYARKHRRHS